MEEGAEHVDPGPQLLEIVPEIARENGMEKRQKEPWLTHNATRKKLLKKCNTDPAAFNWLKIEIDDLVVQVVPIIKTV